jgi:hypothetical protein
VKLTSAGLCPALRRGKNLRGECPGVFVRWIAGILVSPAGPAGVIKVREAAFCVGKRRAAGVI